MGLTPDVFIAIGGADRSAVLKSRLLSVHVTTNTGNEADEVELEFDDRGGLLALPRRGVVLTLSIGWKGKPLVAQGSFTVDEVNPSGPPDKIGVKAKSADMKGTLKAAKSGAFRQMTTEQIVAQIAADHNMTASVHPDLSGIMVDHRDQTNESDLHFLTRLAKDHGAVVAPKGGKLVMVPSGAAATAGGKDLTPIALTRRDLSRWELRQADRSDHKSVRASWRDGDGATTNYETAGSGDPTKTLLHPHRDAASAGHAAHAGLKRGKQKADTLEVDTVLGDPRIFAGRPIVVTDLRDGLNGKWICSKVEHEIDWESKGFTTKAEATVSGLSADAAQEAAASPDDSADGGGDEGDTSVAGDE